MRIISLSFIFSSIVLLIGCNEKSMEIRIENQSGSNVKNVVFSANEKSFELAVIGNATHKGYNTAERLFGNRLPENVTLDFETIDGESFSRRVKILAGSNERKLHLLIDDKHEVTARLE